MWLLVIFWLIHNGRCELMTLRSFVAERWMLPWIRSLLCRVVQRARWRHGSSSSIAMSLLRHRECGITFHIPPYDAYDDVIHGASSGWQPYELPQHFIKFVSSSSTTLIIDYSLNYLNEHLCMHYFYLNILKYLDKYVLYNCVTLRYTMTLSLTTVVCYI